MKVSAYIGDLLYDHECIVVPGLGGFITSISPAKVDDNNNTFTPPGKNIVFNAHLQINDGLLLNHIATLEGISHNEARIKLESFVEKCKNAIDNGKRIHFHKIGTLRNNSRGNMVFEPDQSYNYAPDAFGLSGFISPPIKRESSIRINPRFKDRKPDKTEKNTETKTAQSTGKNETNKYLTINFFWVFFIMGLAAIAYLKSDTLLNLYNRYSGYIPFFYSTPSDFIAENFADKAGTLDLIPENIKSIANKPVPVNQTSKTGFGFSFNDYSKTLDNKKAFDTSEEPLNTIDNENNEPSDNIEEVSDNRGSLITPGFGEPAVQHNETSNISREVSLEGNNSYAKTEIEKEPVTPEPIPVQLPKEAIASNQKYFIIAGSFMNLNNAHKLVDELQNKGYPAAVIGQNKYGDHRVCYAGFSTLNEAEQELTRLKNEANPSAWLFIKH